MPKPIVDVLDQASRKMMKDPAAIKFLEDIAAVPTVDTSPELTAKFINDEIAKWALRPDGCACARETDANGRLQPCDSPPSFPKAWH